MNRRTGESEIHAFTICHTNQGYVLAHWFTSLDDYGLYVDTLRQAVNSISVSAANKR
jgi:hypothetical protein